MSLNSAAVGSKAEECHGIRTSLLFGICILRGGGGEGWYHSRNITMVNYSFYDWDLRGCDASGGRWMKWRFFSKMETIYGRQLSLNALIDMEKWDLMARCYNFGIRNGWFAKSGFGDFLRIGFSIWRKSCRSSTEISADKTSGKNSIEGKLHTSCCMIPGKRRLVLYLGVWKWGKTEELPNKNQSLSIHVQWNRGDIKSKVTANDPSGFAGTKSVSPPHPPPVLRWKRCSSSKLLEIKGNNPSISPGKQSGLFGPRGFLLDERSIQMPGNDPYQRPYVSGRLPWGVDRPERSLGHERMTDAMVGKSLGFLHWTW